MRKILPILALIVLLCGCSNAEPLPTETSAPTTEPVAVKLYIPQSQLEQQTAGAVREYAADMQFNWIAPISGGVLLASGDNNTTLHILSGIDGTVTASKELPLKLKSGEGWQITASGFAYYDPTENAVVYLNLQLEETSKIILPEDISGAPVITKDCAQIFYCQGQTVSALETDRKISRPVRTNTCKTQTLTGCYFNGAVVGCRIVDDAGTETAIYISGENGELLHKGSNIERICASDDHYFAIRNEGILRQYIFGAKGAEPRQLNIPDDTAFGIPEAGRVLGQTEQENEALLSVYNEKKLAAVSLPLEHSIAMAVADEETEGIWLLTDSGKLLRWATDRSVVTEDADYSGPVYTASAPNVEGLQICQERAEEMGKQFGVVIRIWDKALTSNETLHITTEYQPEAINSALTRLEEMLQKFPKNFLYKSVAGQIRICIVRDIDGQVTSEYHWYDGDPFVVLSAGVDIEQAFLDAFSYILDIHVLGNSPYLDNWETLNPEGFAYGQEMTVMAYLEGDSQAFADRKGMQSLVDDRAQVFYQAMQADNAAVFQSETMQAKLKLLCLGIRDAWRLEKSPETFLWEQYLNTSLAYSK